MANPKSAINLVDGYEKRGYKADTKKYICPDCYQVFVNRASKKSDSVDLEAMSKFAKKAYVFRKDGAAPVAACPCGFRKSNGKIQHGKPWNEDFGGGQTPPPYPCTQTAAPKETSSEKPPVEDTTGKCTEICKSTGKRCKNNALPGSDKCGIHGGERMF